MFQRHNFSAGENASNEIKERTNAIETVVDASIIGIPSPAGMTRRVLRGSAWTLGGQVIAILASLVGTPFIIRLLGSESYGVLALISVLIGYLAFADLGMGIASTRFGADAHANSDSERELEVIWTSGLLALVPAICCGIALALSARFLVERVLLLPPHLHTTAVWALRLASVGFVARTMASVVNTPQLVRMRMDLNSLITTISTVGQMLLVVVVLALGGGLIAAVAVMTAVNVLLATVHFIVSRRLTPGLSQPRIKKALIRPLISFGGGLVLSSLAAMVLINVEKLLLTRLVSVTALAHYAVAFMVAGLLALAPQAMTQSLLPAFSQLQAESGRSSLQLLYRRALAGNLLWIAPAALVLCV
ncbi:MAG TPA: oligosaccharide flippase family protein, partial [Pyrinomonadaceae bacterium]